MQKKGICIIEFPHLINLTKKSQFDTIYHEHFSYFSLHAIVNIFKKNGMIVFNCREIPTHGGSLRIYIKINSNDDYKITRKVNEILSKEKKIGVNRISFYKNFNKAIDRIKKINKKKIEILSKNKKLIGYGAAAKSTIFCNSLELNTNHVKFIVDKNRFKINRYIPGSNIPILDFKNIYYYNMDIIDFIKPNIIYIIFGIGFILLNFFYIKLNLHKDDRFKGLVNTYASFGILLTIYR
jgi:hypothetical protein